MPSFGDWWRGIVRRLSGEKPEVSPESQYTEEEEEEIGITQETTPPPPSPPSPPEYVETPIGGDNNVVYEPGYSSGRIQVKPRYSVGNINLDEIDAYASPDMDDFRDLVRTVGYKPVYVIVISGIPCVPYPLHHGEYIETLSYKIGANSVLDHLNTTNSPVEFLGSYDFSYNCWEEIYKISILDV